MRRPKAILSWFREQTFCEFEVEGVRFEAEEPYGDNSRYWIGPSPPRWVAQVGSVREAFLDRQGPSLWFRVVIVVLFMVMVGLIFWRAHVA